MQSLGYGIKPHQVTALFLEFEILIGQLSPEAWTDQHKLLSLISNLHPKTFQELRFDPIFLGPDGQNSDLKASSHRKVQED